MHVDAEEAAEIEFERTTMPEDAILDPYSEVEDVAENVLINLLLNWLDFPLDFLNFTLSNTVGSNIHTRYYDIYSTENVYTVAIPYIRKIYGSLNKLEYKVYCICQHRYKVEAGSRYICP